jgi:hypothetical protein|tara:strand:+ start:123 stop:569 length:447 start_codon:yes stop_codon:yes gene_type:complete
MSFADEYARLEEFLRADPDYARFDAECVRLQKIVDEQGQAAHSATCDFETWSICESTLEFAAMDVPDFDNRALLNPDLVAEQLDAGAKHFQRLKRDCLMKAGEASKAWAEASDQLAVVKQDRQTRRFALVDIYREVEANKKAAEQEAE